VTEPENIAPLPELLRRSAAQYPTRVAVRDARTALSYPDLVTSAGRLASYLAGLGVRPGTRVACALRRSVQAVVVQAAILDAGAVFVPVDPTYPRPLLEEMVRNCDVRAVVGFADDLTRLNLPGVTSVVLDDPVVEQAVADSPSRPTSAAKLDAEAYVIHTSGSTGTPKGVLVGHGAIARSTLARRSRYDSPVEAFLLVSPMTFDSSLAGLWWTLSQGGTVELAPPDPAGTVAALRQALTDRDGRITHTLLTPTLYRQALDGLEAADTAVANRSMARLIVAGEDCPPGLVRSHYRLLPQVPLVNEYGPTEAVVWCSSEVLRPDSDVTIGTPIPGVELFVVDPRGRVVEDGEPGELVVAGEQLAIGYLNDPALTAQRFVSHPRRPDSRAYRTGDRARRRPDRSFELLGRFDDQVKIRGFRVDLAGVRHRLVDHPAVADAVVALRERAGADGVSGPRILTGYVVPLVDEDTVAASLRQTWTQIVDGVAEAAADHGGDFDTSGWTSSYTGEQLPDEDMREWVDQTVGLLREGTPRSVLDLGCGTGLPLLRLAGQCDRYVALDVSQRTLDGVRAAVERAGLHQVELLRGDAAEAENFAGAGFDLVACNSVSQYFPGSRYLTRTLLGALRATHHRGRVVLGDVRDAALQEAFHAQVALARAGVDAPAAMLRTHLDQRLDNDTQLLIDPRWYHAALSGVDIEVRPRRGWRRNEMNDFRYDVVITRAGWRPRVTVDAWVDVEQLRDALSTGTRVIGVRAVRNARTAGAAALVTALRDGSGVTAAELRSLVTDTEADAVHPEALHALAAEFGYRAHLSRATAHPDGSFDAVFVPDDAGDDVLVDFDTPTAATGDGLITEPARRHALAEARATLLPLLREHAEQTLPPHERPGAYVALAQLPTTRNGKVDMKALPPPLGERPPLRARYIEPATATEKVLASTFSALLGIDRVGRDDDFTELGGDSLLAARAARTVAETFGVTLPPGAVFAAPTIADLARLVERADPSQPRARTHAAPRAREATLPLASAQTAFWYLDHYRRPGGSRHPDFALPVHYRISGRLDVPALKAALDQLLARHPALRTRVHLGADEGWQQIESPSPGVLRHRVVISADPQSALREAAKADAEIPLDLAAGRVFTAELTTVADTEHLLVLRVHHMVSDGWSLDVIERELTELYAAATDGRPAALDPPPDYAALVRDADQTYFVDLEWRDTEPNRAALAYWTDATDGAAPIEITRPPDSALGMTRVHSVLLPADTADAVVEAARTSQGTLFSAVLTVLAHLLAADTGDMDVRLMTIAAARDVPGLDRVVALMLNPLFLRLRADAATTFAEGVRTAGETVRATLSHGQPPMLALCEEVPNLLTMMTESQFVAVESLPPVRGLVLPGCHIHRTDPFQEEFLGTGFVLPVDLLVTARRESGMVRISALFDPASFDGGYIRRLLIRMRQVLVVGAANPDTPLDLRPDPGPISPYREETQ
jgi:amino acid adenylation domain-containing protein